METPQAGNQQPSTTVATWLQVKRDPKKVIQDRFETARNAMTGRVEEWRKIRDAYHGYIRQNQKRRGRANFPFYKIFPQTELEAARFVVNYFRHDPFVAVSPQASDDIEKAQRHERVLQHYLEHCPSFYLSELRLIKYASMFGNGFQMPTWRRRVAPVRRKLPVMIGGLKIGEQELVTNEVVYDGLEFHTFAPTDVFPYPFATSLDTAPWVILVQFVRVDELVALADQGIYDKDAVMKIPLNGYLQQDWEIFKQISENGKGGAQAEDNELICLQHMLMPDRFQTLANNDIVIRNRDNHLWSKNIPMVHGVKTIDPDSFWSIGTAKTILPSEKMLQLFVNSMVDAVTSTMWPVWKYVPNRVNPNDLLSLPNQRIPVKSMDDLDIVKLPEMKQDMLAIKIMFEQHIEEITGYFGTQKGEGRSGNTATSDSIFQSEGNNRIQYDVMTFEQVTLIRMAKLVSALVQQFMPEQMDVRLNGPGGVQFAPVNQDDVRGEFDFKASGSSETLNRAVVQQQLIELFNTAQGANQFVQMPGGAIVPVPVLDTYNALKELYEGYGRVNIDKILYRPELFGMPLTNDVLNQFGLPSIPGLDQMQPNPNTGALRAQRKQGGAAQLQNMSRSVDPKQIINNANRPQPLAIGMM